MPVKDVYPATKKNGDPHPAAGLPKYKYTAKGDERVIKKRDTYKYAKKAPINAETKLKSRLGLDKSISGGGETLLAAGAKLTGGTSQGLVSKGPMHLKLIQAGIGSNLLLPKTLPEKSMETIDYGNSEEVSRLFQTAGLKKPHRKKLGEFISSNQDIFTKKGKLRKNTYTKKNTDSQDAAISDFFGQIESSNVFMKQSGLEGMRSLGVAGGRAQGEFRPAEGSAPAKIIGFARSDAKKAHKSAVRQLTGHHGREGFITERNDEGDYHKGMPVTYKLPESRLEATQPIKVKTVKIKGRTDERYSREEDYDHEGKYVGPFREAFVGDQPSHILKKGLPFDATSEIMSQPVIIERYKNSLNQVIMPSFVKVGRSAKNANILLSELTQN